MDNLEVIVSPAAVTQRTPAAWRTILTLAWPVLAQQGLIFIVNQSDRFLAGRFLPDPAYQSVQTTATYLMWLLSAYTVLVSVGAAALVARFVGAGDRDAAIRATNQALLLAIVLGLVGTVAGLVLTGPLLGLLGLEGETAALAAAYLRPLFLLLVFQMVEQAGISCLVGAGDTRTGMWVLGGVALVNLPLAWGFFLGAGPLPRLGFVGIATGTAVSHAFGAAAVVVVLLRGRAGLRLVPRLLAPDPHLLERLLRVSVPAGTDSLSLVLGQLWFLSIVNHLDAEANAPVLTGGVVAGGLSLVNRLDTTASAAHGIALGWEALAYLSGTAFGTAATALVGQRLGAGQPREAARFGWTTYALGCGVMCFMGAVFFTLAPQMFALYCPHPEQAGIIEKGVPVLRLVAFAMPALACTTILTAALRGAGDTRVPVLYTWTGFLLVRIPLAYLLTSPGVGLGLYGAWLAMFADLLVRGGLVLRRFAGGRWQRVKV